VSPIIPLLEDTYLLQQLELAELNQLLQTVLRIIILQPLFSVFNVLPATQLHLIVFHALVLQELTQMDLC